MTEDDWTDRLLAAQTQYANKSDIEDDHENVIFNANSSRLQNLIGMRKDFLVSKDQFEGNRVYLPDDTKDINRITGALNFVYDVRTKTIILNLFRGQHEYFCGTLYKIYNAGAKSMWASEASELYIDRGYGFMQSSVSRRVLKGQHVILTPNEKRLFSGLTFMDM